MSNGQESKEFIELRFEKFLKAINYIDETNLIITKMLTENVRRNIKDYVEKLNSNDLLKTIPSIIIQKGIIDDSINLDDIFDESVKLITLNPLINSNLKSIMKKLVEECYEMEYSDDEEGQDDIASKPKRKTKAEKPVLAFSSLVNCFIGNTSKLLLVLQDFAIFEESIIKDFLLIVK